MTPLPWLTVLSGVAGLSLLSVGGALTVAPELHRLLVGELALVSDAQFSAAVALAQSAPGPNALYTAILGWQLAGAGGAALVLAAFMAPSSALALAVARWGGRLDGPARPGAPDRAGPHHRGAGRLHRLAPGRARQRPGLARRDRRRGLARLADPPPPPLAPRRRSPPGIARSRLSSRGRFAPSPLGKAHRGPTPREEAAPRAGGAKPRTPTIGKLVGAPPPEKKPLRGPGARSPRSPTIGSALGAPPPEKKPLRGPGARAPGPRPSGSSSGPHPREEAAPRAGLRPVPCPAVAPRGRRPPPAGIGGAFGRLEWAA